jgi:hypothetical protein
MNHPNFLSQIEKSYQEAKSGKTTDIEDYLASLEILALQFEDILPGK